MIILSSSKYLGMANKMIQYAHFMVFAEKHKIRLANPSFLPYAAHFEGLKDDLWCRYPAKKSMFGKATFIKKLLASFFHKCGSVLGRSTWNNRFFDAQDNKWEGPYNIGSDDFIRRATTKKMFFVLGWNFYEKEDYTRYRSMITHHLRPLAKYIHNVNLHIEQNTQKEEVLIGVHIRQGDYKKFLDGKYYYDTAAYVRMMKELTEKNADKKIRFLICSNEQQELHHFKGLDFFFGTGHPVEDMYCLAKCQYILGPPSTYSMWASFAEAVPLYMIEDPKIKFNLSDFTPFNLSLN